MTGTRTSTRSFKSVIGLSQVRETNTFAGLPVMDRHERLECGIAAINLDTGSVIARLEFESGIEEIFDIQVLDATCVSLGGESSDTGGQS